MEWLTNNGEVYHRACTGWTASIQDGKCQHCASAIPEPILRLARDQATDRERQTRSREQQRKTREIAKRFAEVQARTEATLKRSSYEPKSGK